MAENCNHDCSSCSANCASRAEDMIQKAAANAGSHVKKVIGVISGKGGVGKSMTSSLLAVAAGRLGLKAGILDGDITGPSIPHMFGLNENAMSDGVNILPSYSDKGCAVMSLNLLLENPEDPVIWRGGMIASAVTQFWTDVAWGDLDYLFIDMPPGTGDVPLTVFQSLPVDGVIVVTTPQDLVSMVVEKALRMAEKMDIPVLGIVENMSYITCPDCGKKIYIFGEGHVEDFVKSHNIPNYAQMPIDRMLAGFADAGRVEEAPEEFISEMAKFLKSDDE
ncbi:MAG: Mrp/NBP35 family ATP-binding protein [Lachnospiraceae bacterium]|nr:Mrp/NBP35 family ATP-binding protein [Candidatus Equihabitans merdae]